MISPLELILSQDVVFILLLSCLTCIIFLRNRGKNGLPPLPPAPRGLPFVGNFFQIPRSHHAKNLQKIHQELNSPIVRLSAFGSHIIDISDSNLLKELLEKRSRINSSRPSTLYYQKYIDPVGRYWMMSSNESIKFKLGRELTHRVMITVRQGRTHKLQEMEAKCSLNNLLNLFENGDVNGWVKEINRFSGSVATCATYGFKCPSADDPRIVKLMELGDNALRGVLTVSIINFFPILDKIPGPMPWRTSTESFRREDARFQDMLLKEAIHGEGAEMDTWSGQFFYDEQSEDARTARSELKPLLVTTLVLGATETTSITLMSFMLAYMLYPDAFTNVVEQITAVVGFDRLPNFDDERELFLVEATFREILRWRPPGPQGGPHSSIEDQVVQFVDKQGNIKEYFIPKGSVIFGNEYAIDSDSLNWDEPNKFMIERWLDENGRLRDWNISPDRPFGYGRRECPGRDFAAKSLFIMISSILWGFKAQKAVDPITGNAYHYSDTDSTGQITDAPKPFPCELIPRSKHHEEVIRKSWEAQDKDLNNLMHWVD